MRRRALLLCAVLLCAGCSEPPQKEIDRAQGAIDAARAAGAEQYAASEFSAATAALQQAHEAVQQRDYRLALSRAVDANSRAQDAAKQAADGKARVRSEAESAISSTSAALQQLQTKLNAATAARIPQRDLKGARQVLAHGQQTLQKARAAVKDGAYLEARDALRDVPAKITPQIRALDELTKARSGRRRR
jgi:hypothetical protein